MTSMSAWPGVIERYRSLLDLPHDAPAITLLEGGTPLIPAPRLASMLGAKSLLVKFEGLNPTGSFKDRGMTTAISEAVHRHARAVICASTGNTAASAAAYAARAGLRCLVLIPAGKVAAGKLAGALAYGAEVRQLEDSFDAALSLVMRASERLSIALVNSLNPYRLEGQKTVAFEINEALGRAPDWLALPVGNAGNITAAWMGFRQAHAREGGGLPHLLGVQAAGAAPLVHGHPIDSPETIATAIRIGRPARGEQALQAAAESGGAIIAVPDEALLEAQRLLAGEGLWVEPASAAGLAGMLQQVQADRLKLAGKTVVCLCTGHGLKDPDIITQRFSPPPIIPPGIDSLAQVLSE
jgi:threonine synthase